MESRKNVRTLRIDGEVARPLELSLADLAALDHQWQIADMSQLDAKRKGRAVKLAGILALARPSQEAAYLTLHATADNFHASVPLDALRDRAVVIYSLEGGPLPAGQGGPFRFYVPDFAACHSAEVDECANVKFVDRMELTRRKGFDNRPQDEQQHAALHDQEPHSH